MGAQYTRKSALYCLSSVPVMAPSVHSPFYHHQLSHQNSQIGDARFTDMSLGGLLNIGQLVREKYGSANTALVGLGTHSGTVMAGKKWGAPMEVSACMHAMCEHTF